MFVLCVLYSKGLKAKPGQRSTDIVPKKKSPSGVAGDFSEATDGTICPGGRFSL
jgi:hypothetical protein